MSASRLLAFVVAAALLGAGAGPAVAAARGVGATFPAPVYARWAALFAAETGEAVAYEAAGSGAGQKAYEDPGAAFGASDLALDAEALKARALVQVPTLVGGIVPVLNLPGVGPGDLVLDGQALADLFEGRIAAWDDPALRRLNPHLPLPHLAVTPVRRSDSSGTTAVFAGYLAAASTHDPAYLGRTPPALRPIGLAAEGSKGVAAAIAATSGAVGYLGFDYAQAGRLAYADLVNPAGRAVQPTLASIAAAAADADWSRGTAPSLVAEPGGASWPIVSATYVLMRRFNNDAAAARTAVKFLAWGARSGGPAAEDLGFVPLPEAAAADAAERLRAVGDASGNALVPQP